MDQEIYRSKPNLLITGTPGTGKTTLSKLLGNYIEGLQVINLGQYILEKKLYKEWNEEFDVPEFDEDMVVDDLEDLMAKGGVIIDFHSSGFFPERWFDIVVLLRTNNTILYDRLAARGYTQKKINENIECEIFETCKEEVYQSYKPQIILEIANEYSEQMEKSIELIIGGLKQWKIQNDIVKNKKQ